MKALAVLLAVSTFQPKIPKTWKTSDVEALEVPLANPKYSPIHISEVAYYRIPVRMIYKTYPVYHPSHEPAGYMDWLKQQEPEIAFDLSRLRTREDWVKAGEVVFNAPTSYPPVFFSAANLRDPSFVEKTGMPVAKDGTVPFARWVIRRRGEVELGSMGCNTCHTRVMTDGAVVPGAQGNNPGDRQGASMLRGFAKSGDPVKVLERIRAFTRQFEMPWLPDDPNRRAQEMSLDELVATGEEIPPGVTARSNTSMFVPPQIPDLIGVEERRYLDHTGLVRHRGIGDLMRYSSLVQDMSGYDRYGDLQPLKPDAGHAARIAMSNYTRSYFTSIRFGHHRIRTASTPSRCAGRKFSSARGANTATRHHSTQTTNSSQWMVLSLQRITNSVSTSWKRESGPTRIMR